MKNLLKTIALFLLLTSTLFANSGIEKATDYQKNSNLQWNWAINALEGYPFSGNERILDVGCGDGKITAFIADKASHGPVVGLDVSKSMIALASKTFSPSAYGNLLFMEGDITHLPFHSQFDLAVAFCSLHWVLDQETALSQVYESLVPGGHLLVVGPAKLDSNLSTVSERLVKTKKWAPHFLDFKVQRVYYTAGEYATLLKQAGFVPVELEVSMDTEYFPSRQALLEWLKPLITFVKHLSPSLQNEFIEDVAKEMLSSPQAIQSDGSLLLESAKIKILAQKN